MKAVVQRCQSARVEVEEKVVGEIEFGIAVFLCAMEGDEESDAKKLAQKIATLRIFDNAEGRFDLNIKNVGGAILLVSNFTIAGETRKGNRPNFGGAAKPERARELLELFATLLRAENIAVSTGEFGADMKVFVANDGPVTIILDTRQ